jgi:Holliday junction resolvase RusA-like endonuclease
VIIFELHGEPVGWQRAGVRIVKPKFGKQFATIYTPAETRKYERALALAAQVAARGKLLAGPLRLVVTAFMPVPASWSRKKRDAALAGVVRPTVKPDWDNLGKMTDALKGVVWTDDAQVVDGRVLKFYDEKPRLRVEVSELQPFEEEEDDRRPALDPTPRPGVPARA